MESSNSAGYQRLLGGWYSWIAHASIGAKKDANKMINVHLKNIMNYFIHRTTNARAEGINSKIVLIEKTAFVYRNKGALKIVI